MIVGVLQALSGGLLLGMWMVLIGWFLANAASAGFRQMVVHDLLRGLTARDLMRSHFESVSPQVRVEDFIEAHLLQSAQLLWPVEEEGQLVGLLSMAEVKDIPGAERGNINVGQVMRTDLGAMTLRPDVDAASVLAQLAGHGGPMAVTEGDRVIGLLAQSDAVRWLLLHQR